MEKYQLFLEEDGCTWLTGEVIKVPQPVGPTGWELYWEGGSFVFFGGLKQLKAELKKLADNKDCVFFGHNRPILEEGQKFKIGESKREED